MLGHRIFLAARPSQRPCSPAAAGWSPWTADGGAEPGSLVAAASARHHAILVRRFAGVLARESFCRSPSAGALLQGPFYRAPLQAAPPQGADVRRPDGMLRRLTVDVGNTEGGAAG